MHNRGRHLKLWGVATGVGIASLAAVLVGPRLPADASGVTGAQSTTVNVAMDGQGHCLNNSGLPNCNLYDGKKYVWFSGLPISAALGAGTYFWSVLSPGGQQDPNDGAANVLSLYNAGDPYQNRTFKIDSSGSISYSGTHDLNNNMLRVGLPQAWYGSTPNPGGVYVLAVCSLANGYPVDPKRCKYDNFKVFSAPTWSPVTRTSMHRVGPGRVKVTWNLVRTSDVIGFAGYAGSHLLSPSLIAVHRQPTYSAIFDTRAGVLILRTLLRNGRHVDTRIGH